MFLEHSDMGYPAYEGSQSRPQSDSVIINELGLGIVKFAEGDDGGPEPSGANAEYRCNTDVITSVNLSADSQIDPDSTASVTFHILGGSYTVTNIVIPEGESQLVWVKWHTPTTPQTVPITVSASKGYLDVGMISAKVVSLEGYDPPDPKATDRNDSFTVAQMPHNIEQLASSWGVWNAIWIPNLVWQENWVWVDHPEWESGGEWVDNGFWVDDGEWQYSFTSYHATLSASMTLSPDDKVPTAAGKTMRSGYGVKISVNGTVHSSAPTSQYTVGQTAISYFPEFAYKSYWRLLDLTKDGDAFSFAFKPNIYSTYNRRVHFTPVWYPDGQYAVFTFLEDAWTPAGQLKADLSDCVTIDGSVYDDRHVGPKLVD